jgi:cytochrome b6-f complex iron-sulfur subunit
MDNPKTSRREFCAHAISFVTIASLVEGCGGKSPTSPGGGGGGSNATTLAMINGSVSGRTVSVNIDAASPLASAGSAAFVQSTIGRFLVARTGEQVFTALTAVCTHEQCDVTTFSSSSSRFVCPCHGSQYTTSGAVANGPATRPLQSFATTFTNNVLSFTA